MGLNPYGSADEQSDGEDDDDDDDDDDGDDDLRYDPRNYTRSASCRRPDERGRGEGESSSGGRRTSGGRPPTTDQGPGPSSSGHGRRASFAGSGYVQDDVPFDHHRQSFGSYEHHPSHQSTDSWSRGLTVTSHERAPHPESQQRQRRRTELNEIEESAEPSSDRLTSAGKMLPMSNFKTFSRYKKK